MSLHRLSYSEFLGQPNEWILSECDFTQINLIVGRNATGKTRLINVINGFCRLVSGKHATPYESGSYAVVLMLDGKEYSIELEFSAGIVAKELLLVDGVRRLNRDASGKGEIFYEGKGEYIEFQVDPKVIAFQQRRDELQHSFIVKVANWAGASQLYQFGSSLGRDRLMIYANYQATLDKMKSAIDSDDLVPVYSKAFDTHGGAFDDAVMADMRELGYELTDVGTTDMRTVGQGLNVPEPVIGVFVTENERPEKLSQLQMSQGMYRALAMIVHINAASFERKRTLVLLDDIGEGLDFERSTALIDILTKHAQRSGLQVIMTTNDRFVMNRVPLEYWSLLRRNRSKVTAYTERNSPAEFSEFRFIGLNNFDFFASATLH